MSITKVSDFSKDLFTFEDVTNQGSKFNWIKILTQDRDPLLLKVENCFSYGVIADDRFGKIKYSVPIVLEDRESFLSALELVESEVDKYVNDPPEYGRGERLMRRLYRKNWHPVLYAKIDGDTRMYPPTGDKPVNHKKCTEEAFYLDAVVRVDGVYTTEDVISIRVTLHEARVLKDPPRKPRKMLL